jgi:hypothetical protein
LVRTARRLRKLPVTDSLWAIGELSASQVQAIMVNLADDEVTDLFAQHEAEVVPTLVALSVRDTAVAMQTWAAAADALRNRPDPDEPDRSLHLSKTFGGRGEMRASFDPEGTELIAIALRLSATDDVEGEPVRSPARKRADALVDLCRWFLDHQQTQRGGRHRPHLNVVLNLELGDNLDEAAVARLLDGPPLDAVTLRRMLCDAGLHRYVTDGLSTILDYGRTTHTVSAAVSAALGIRDEHCRFPGCDRPITWCEAHHVRPWSKGGPTNLRNLCLLCSRHHHLVHRPGWALTLQANGDVEVTTPDGRMLRSSLPNAPPLPLRLAG